MKKILPWAVPLLIGLVSGMTGAAQSNKFSAPKWADTLTNPLRGQPAATEAGKQLYRLYCTPCHGNKGKGDGVAAAGLSKPPADHTSAAVQKLSDGALFWMIGQGNNPMPAYEQALTSGQRWELVDFIRTLRKSSSKLAKD